ncbi:class I SAM-dependent methyltransferase [Agrobacterium vitis]|uniref:class I SAM-dependent methyltransferase n=1 Tax=Agrobacterium vitis TaxID=373 RepID=UPI0012E8FE4B|nr:class I SAM-dependent methyltransferase [Agrobacterium vitis]MVA52142.1 methyltransferase [Agrobacterium vitis]NSZ51420.1 class I SAM-dependent methyltransferase [Agrobacterium vitis]NTA30178.1 class I SAM-dependent methyltransferase [Agrobacterium vitis]
MSRETLKTIFHPFVTEAVALPGEDERFLFLGAEAGFVKPEGFGAELTVVQGFRPDFRRLEAARQTPVAVVTGEDYDGALVLAGKHKGLNENRVAEALARVRAGGVIIVAGAKEDGIQPLRKQIDRLGLEPLSLPKYHGIAVWFTVPEDKAAAIAALASKPVMVEGRFETYAGQFSHMHADPGSELLVSRLPEDFDGNAADFGAGWGYLSVMLAEKARRTNRIDLFEANYDALEQAKKNLARNCPHLTARFFWQDLGTEPPKEKYDLVIMNPPFHEGHATEPSIGEAMIKAAADALRGGGDLLMVANRGLAYEPVLGANFRQHGETCRNARYKVLWAKK